MGKLKFTKKNTIILVTVLGAFWVIGTFIPSDKSEVVNNIPKKEDTLEKPDDKVNKTEKFQIDTNLSLEENINNMLKKNLKDEILEISYKETNGSAPLFIKTKGSSMFFETTWYNIAESTIRHMPDELKSKISEYNFEIHSDFIDKFGNNIVDKAMTFKIDKETASKINWTMMYSEKLKPLLMDVWENPAVKK